MTSAVYRGSKATNQENRFCNKYFDFQDTIFISVANVLHRAGYINDAIMTMSYALQSSRDVVVSQFTMANLYAAKVSIRYKSYISQLKMFAVTILKLKKGLFLEKVVQKVQMEWQQDNDQTAPVCPKTKGR